MFLCEEGKMCHNPVKLVKLAGVEIPMKVKKGISAEQFLFFPPSLLFHNLRFTLPSVGFFVNSEKGLKSAVAAFFQLCQTLPLHEFLKNGDMTRKRNTRYWMEQNEGVCGSTDSCN